MAYTDRNLSNLTISESFWRLMQTDPVDDKTLLDGTGSLVTYLAISGTLDAYYLKGDGSQLTNLPVSIPAGTVSSSAQTISNLSGTNIVSGSGQRSVLGLGTTDSPTFGGLTVTGTLTAKEFHTQLVSSSIIYQSGSTKFGDTSDDTHQFTGSVLVSGSVTATAFVGDGSGLTGIVNALPNGLISGSQQISDFGFVSSSEWNDILNKPVGLVSSSAQTISNLSGTNIVSGSDQRSVLGLGENDSPRFGNIYSTNGNFDGNVVIGGTLTARTYVVSSSVVNYETIQVSGSSKFGDSADDTHEFTGSLFVSNNVTAQSFTGSLEGTSSQALTASYALNAAGFESGSFATTASNTFTGNQNFATGTVIGDTIYSTLGGNPIDLYYGVSKGDIANRFGGVKISEYDWGGGNLASKFEVYTDSEANDFSTRRLLIDGFGNASISANTEITGNLTVTGILTAQEFHTEIVSSSIIYESGSTKFGDSVDDRHSFTGSLQVSGALVIPTVQSLSPSADVGSIVINNNSLYIYL